MVTLTAEGSLGNITALKQDICGVIRDKQSYTVGSTTLTLDGFLEVDGQEYFETLCVVSVRNVRKFHEKLMSYKVEKKHPFFQNSPI